ncbi:MAG: hypothetical protein ACI3YD_00045 [Alloprevotella sp.]
MAKIVQGERNAKEKLKDFHFAFPSRRLSYQKIVQGERNAKEKLKDFHFAFPSFWIIWNIRKVQNIQNVRSPATINFPEKIYFTCDRRYTALKGGFSAGSATARIAAQLP